MQKDVSRRVNLRRWRINLTKEVIFRKRRATRYNGRLQLKSPSVDNRAWIVLRGGGDLSPDFSSQHTGSKIAFMYMYMYMSCTCKVLVGKAVISATPVGSFRQKNNMKIKQGLHVHVHTRTTEMLFPPEHRPCRSLTGVMYDRL